MWLKLFVILNFTGPSFIFVKSSGVIREQFRNNNTAVKRRGTYGMCEGSILAARAPVPAQNLKGKRKTQPPLSRKINESMQIMSMRINPLGLNSEWELWRPESLIYMNR